MNDAMRCYLEPKLDWLNSSTSDDSDVVFSLLVSQPGSRLEAGQLTAIVKYTCSGKLKSLVSGGFEAKMSEQQ